MDWTTYWTYALQALIAACLLLILAVVAAGAWVAARERGDDERGEIAFRPALAFFIVACVLAVLLAVFA